MLKFNEKNAAKLIHTKVSKQCWISSQWIQKYYNWCCVVPTWLWCDPLTHLTVRRMRCGSSRSTIYIPSRRISSASVACVRQMGEVSLWLCAGVLYCVAAVARLCLTSEALRARPVLKRAGTRPFGNNNLTTVYKPESPSRNIWGSARCWKEIRRLSVKSNNCKQKFLKQFRR